MSPHEPRGTPICMVSGLREMFHPYSDLHKSCPNKPLINCLWDCTLTRFQKRNSKSEHPTNVDRKLQEICQLQFYRITTTSFTKTHEQQWETWKHIKHSALTLKGSTLLPFPRSPIVNRRFTAYLCGKMFAWTIFLSTNAAFHNLFKWGHIISNSTANVCF